MEDTEEKGVMAGLAEELSRLQQQILDSRVAAIKNKLEENRKRLDVNAVELLKSASSRRDNSVHHDEDNNLLSVRKKNSFCRLNGFKSGVGEKESTSINFQEELSSTIVFVNSSGGKCAANMIKLPHIEKIPPYATWIFLDRNQRMGDDQSVVGRRQIYYDQNGGETVLCSDSEVELLEPEEEKHNFSDGEDQLLWNALRDHGSSPQVLNVLKQLIDATTIEIEERYEVLRKKYSSVSSGPSAQGDSGNVNLEKTLVAALDSFDNLFCRRCLVFDCRPHGCSQNLVFPSEKLPFSMDQDDYGKPCSEECYLHQGLIQGSCFSKLVFHANSDSADKSKGALCQDEDVNAGEVTSAIDLHVDISVPISSVNKGKRKILGDRNSNSSLVNVMPLGTDKKQKNIVNDKVSKDVNNQGQIIIDLLNDKHLKSGSRLESSQRSTRVILPRHGDSSKDSDALKLDGQDCWSSKIGISHELDNVNTNNNIQKVENRLSEPLAVRDPADLLKRQSFKRWSPLEKDLYMKGVEIFGKNSCLIARNLLSGLKTCMEIADYMFSGGMNMSNKFYQAKLRSKNDVADADYMEQDMPVRARMFRRRGRARKLKYTWKSAGHPSIRKRIADGNERCKQYTPCDCQQMCTRQCPCLENANCCEKYCGCSKSCKNRFRGCHCAKSQCRSRQCPCFAAGRECDPDVCRNCWVSCGDGSIVSLPARGDGYQCGNMKLLLRQQQRILLGRSDVAGWGAFIKNAVNKNDYLGEYTGELISHKEADKRGKIYDRVNSSFLFDLNDQFVLDAFRKGDKLKFANHSSNPNCYAKILLVAGDHRVGIFANEHIDAGEELFYDYRYGPDQAPTWARKPEGSRKDDSSSQGRRARKAA